MEECRYWIFICVVVCLIQMTIASGCPPKPYDIPECGMNNTCPSVSPFLSVNGSSKECVSTCGPGKVVRDTICIDIEKCERPIVHDGQCLQMCPTGYVYFPESYNDFFSYLNSTKEAIDGTTIYRHYDSEEHRIICQKPISCVIAISIFFAVGCLWSLLIYAFLHPRPCYIVPRLMRRLKHRQNPQTERDDGAPAAGVVVDGDDDGDDDEPLLNNNLSVPVQSHEDDIMIV